MRRFAAMLLVVGLGVARGDDLARRADTITAEDRQHWSFRPVRRPAVPALSGAAWGRNEIDRFVLAKLREKGWSPAPEPSPLALLRRVHFDLVGLPPSPEEQDAFLRDPSPEALDRVVDDLLARPSHGERWARHWLDLARFAESNGFERDATKPNAWRYRDWVIRALNADLPYDRFLVDQIAGDERPDSDADSLIATGFARLGPWDDEPADPKQDRFDQLDDIVATTSEVVMGLTLGCARCHDHKFEPLTQVDYYRMVAVFAPLERPRIERTELDLPVGTAAELAALAERDRTIAEHRTTRERLLAEPLRATLASPSVGLPPAVREAIVARPEARTEAQTRLVQEHSARMEGTLREAMTPEARADVDRIDNAIRDLIARTPDLPRGYVFREPSATPPPTHLLLRGQATAPGPVVAPGVPAVLVDSQPEFPPPEGATTRRRLTLARWLVRPDHPLTARVIVNRVWQFHMGEGLVRSPSDLGTNGDEPTHPELLDWLADWFVRDAHWSLKKLHRLILTSQTARMGKLRRADSAAEDPDNLLLAHLPYRRLEVEAIRDAMLAASGRLNPAMFGPSMYPEVPKAAIEGHSDPDKVWKASDEREASRRTIYAFVKRSLVVPMIEVLDFCDTTRSTARRLNTSTAPQALALLNGDFVNRQARHFADRLIREAGDDPTRQIDRAYRLALGRPARPGEVASWSGYLDREAAALGGDDARRKALGRMARVLFNLNEFAYTD